ARRGRDQPIREFRRTDRISTQSRSGIVTDSRHVPKRDGRHEKTQSVELARPARRPTHAPRPYTMPPGAINTGTNQFPRRGAGRNERADSRVERGRDGADRRWGGPALAPRGRTDQGSGKCLDWRVESLERQSAGRDQPGQVSCSNGAAVWSPVAATPRPPRCYFAFASNGALRPICQATRWPGPD